MLGELVLRDRSGDFLLVHSGPEFLSLARKPDATGDVLLVRFAPEHSSIVGAGLDAVIADPKADPLTVSVGADVIRLRAVREPNARALQMIEIANQSRSRAGAGGVESVTLDLVVAADTAEALRGERTAAGANPGSAVLEARDERRVAVEHGEAATRITDGQGAVAFRPGLSRVVAAVIATVIRNPGEHAIRFAHVHRGDDHVTVERLATGSNASYLIANTRPGRPQRRRRSVRMRVDEAGWILRLLVEGGFGG